MADTATPSTFPPVESELLVATCTPASTFVFRNAAWQLVFGRTADPWKRLADEDLDVVSQAIRQAAKGALVTGQLCSVQTPARDEPLPVLMNFLPVHFPAESGRLDVRAVNITGEVLAEPSSWTVSQTQRHRMEALGRMTMGIVHDFNNLLSALLGHAELLQRQVEEGQTSPAAFKESLYTIEQAAVDGATLVEKIQRYIRQETQSHFEPLDLPTLIEDCVTLTRPYWYNEPRRQGIAITFERALHAVPPVMGSATELREVFVNMILNAVQALPKGGTLTAETTYSTRKGVLVTVADTGTGMTKAVRERIFEPLFTTKGDQGSGMGLAVSYGIIQEHEGTIAVDSAPGAGTRFTLAFPPAEKVPEEAQAEDDLQTTRPARILVVDDEQMVRSILQKLLTLKGHTVEQAASGAEALALLEKSSFDLVFTDHGMPAMNGRQLARALRRRFPRLPIILLTGDTDIGDIEDVDLTLSKPFKLNKLERAIQALLC